MTSESTVRKQAKKQGYRIEKSRARNERDTTFGMYRVVDSCGNVVAGGHPQDFSMTLEDLAAWLEAA